jgi:hypothetical protein
MGVPWKAFDEIHRPFIAKVVKQQKGVKLGGILKPEGTVQFDACAFHRGLGGAGL